MQDKRIPVVLLTGFLGSGKTSLLAAILHDPAMAGAAVLINEVGEVGLDHLLVQQLSEEITLLESGCLCCSVRGDFARSLRELFMRRLRREIGALDRIVIETSGLADPAPIIHTLMRDFFLAERFRLEGVLTTVDVRNVHWQLGQHAEAVKQVAMADRIVLTKCDLADSLQIEEAEERIAALNPTAQCWHSEPGKLPAGLLQGMSLYDATGKPADVARWLGEAAIQEQEALQARGKLFAPPALHDDTVTTYLLRFAEPFNWGDFARAMDTLQSVVGDRILRVKGLVNVVGEDAPRIVHAVQHERHANTSLPAWPEAYGADRSTRLVFIVRDLPRSVLDKAFAAFAEQAPENAPPV